MGAGGRGIITLGELDGTLEDVCIWIASGGGYYADINLVSWNSAPDFGNYYSYNNFSVVGSIAAAFSGTGESCFTSLDIDMPSGYFYGLWVYQMDRNIYGTSTQVYADIDVWHYGSVGNPANADPNINNPYIVVNWTPLPDYTIDLTLPTSSASLADFQNFIINYELEEPQTNGVFACIAYGTSSDPAEMEYLDCESVVNTAGAHGRSITKRSLLQNGTYYAQAQLYKNVNCPPVGPCENSLLAESSVNEFTITGPYIPGSYWNPPTSTASSSEWVLTCDSVSGAFSNSFCSVLVYLFIPKSADFTRWSDLKSELDTKPPFGYFSSFSEAISALSTSSPSSIAFADLSSLDTSLFDRFKTGFSWVLWVMFGFWGFQKLREIQL